MSQSADPGFSKWLTLNGVPTCIQACGGFIAEEIKGNSIIILISGNPGISDFYVPFIKSLNEKCDGIPVWAIGHAGHIDHEECPNLEDQPGLFDMEGQIKHKKEFIMNYVPKGKKIILMGHSMGAKICVELMKDESINNLVEQVHLMFPCLENISSTPNGIMFEKYGVHIFPFIARLTAPIKLFPSAVAYFILKLLAMLRFMTTNVDDSIVRGMERLFSVSVVDQAVFLAKDEMIKVKDLDDEVYEKYGSKIFVYYGQTDRWSPLSHYENLKKMHPNVTSTVLDYKFKHAFMIRQGPEMAEELVHPIRLLSQ